MIYSQPALWGSLLLASSVELEVWDAEFSAQFVNGETQQAASPTPKKLEQEDGPVSKGLGSPKTCRIGGLGWEGVERQT